MAATPRSPSSNIPAVLPNESGSKVELTVSCKGLLDKDLMSKSDPMCIVYILESSEWKEIGRTERLENTLNPEFARSIVVEYFFEEVQKLRFTVYDIDDPTCDIKQADFLGEMYCTMGQIVASKTHTFELRAASSPTILTGKSAGTITISAEEVLSVSKDIVHLYFKAEKLDKKDFLGKSDPYLEMMKVKEDGSYSVVHRTEYVRQTLNPVWKPVVIKVQQLCGGDYDRTIKINCHDWDSDGSHDYIGSFTTNLREMLESKTRQVTWNCINEKKTKKKNYVNSGKVTLTKCEVSKEYTFFDYVSAGCEIHFTIGIDFTASNGNPQNPSSLHYINAYAPNEYTRALIAVGEVIQDYDSDKMYAAFGFGARIPPQYDVSHQFPLNFDEDYPYCTGLEGLLQAYQVCVSQIQLFGPTNISPIVNQVADIAREMQVPHAGQNYYILLILTDGVISDMEQTKQAIVEASRLPMSIIIVGVGGDDFKLMEELDSDDRMLKSGGRVAQRDIVQFVPFRQFVNSPPAALAKCVLAEVPKQLTDYYRARNIMPRNLPR